MGGAVFPPCYLPGAKLWCTGESHGGRSLVSYSPRGWKESNTFDWVTSSLSNYGALMKIMATSFKRPHACTASVLYVCTVVAITTLNIHWKDWCWSWSSNTLATWYEEPTHWKRPQCWEWLRAGRDGGNRMRWLDGIINSMDMSFSKLRELGSLACCSPWSRKESDTAEQLNNNKLQCSALCLAQIKHSLNGSQQIPLLLL